MTLAVGACSGDEPLEVPVTATLTEVEEGEVYALAIRATLLDGLDLDTESRPPIFIVDEGWIEVDDPEVMPDRVDLFSEQTKDYFQAALADLGPAEFTSESYELLIGDPCFVMIMTLSSAIVQDGEQVIVHVGESTTCSAGSSWDITLTPDLDSGWSVVDVSLSNITLWWPEVSVGG